MVAIEKVVGNKNDITGFHALKGMAIISVIMVHVISFNPNDYNPFDSSALNAFGILRYIFNLAVPIFFSISGFLLSCSLKEKPFDDVFFEKKVKRLFKPLAFWAAFYYIFPEIEVIEQYGFLRSYYWKLTSFFNDPSYFLSTLGTGHLWYLVSTIYALFIIKLLHKNFLYIKYTVIVCLFLYPVFHKYLQPVSEQVVGFNPRPGFMYATLYIGVGMMIEGKLLSNKDILKYIVIAVIAVTAVMEGIDGIEGKAYKGQL